jgi:hypothetical protein
MRSKQVQSPWKSHRSRIVSLKYEADQNITAFIKKGSYVTMQQSSTRHGRELGAVKPTQASSTKMLQRQRHPQLHSNQLMQYDKKYARILVTTIRSNFTEAYGVTLE